VEPQPPQSSIPPPPPPGPSANDRPAAGSSTSAAPPAVTVCPVCSEPRAEDARFCEECGHDFGSTAPAAAEERGPLSGPVFWLVLVFWVALGIGALFFLYTVLWAI
jgi:hypothetical protein